MHVCYAALNICILSRSLGTGLLTETTVSSAPAVNPVLSSGDFSQVVQEKTERKLTDDEKYYLLTAPLQRTSFHLCYMEVRRGHFSTAG